MSQADSPLPGTDPAPGASSQGEARPTDSRSPQASNAVSKSPGVTWLMVLAGGLLAGIAAFVFGEYAIKLCAPSLELPPEIRGDQILAPREHARRLLVSQD